MIPATYRRALGGHGGGVFYLHGEDDFRKREAARAIAEAHLDPATRDFNFDVMTGSELDVRDFASVLATPPMMAEWRVVLVHGAEALAPLPAARKLVLDMAASPPEGLALILTATQPKRSRARFYRDVVRAARSLEFRPVRANDLPGFLVSWCRDRHGAEMNEDAARALAAAVGSDMGVLAQEIAKLVAMTPGGRPITVETVEEGGIRIPRLDPWRWFDLVGGRDFSAATAALGELFMRGESGVYLVMGLTTHFLRIGLVLDGGLSGLEAALPPHQRWLARRIQGQSRGWNRESLDAALLGLRRVDRLMKASALPHHHLLEEWLLAQRTSAGEAGRPRPLRAGARTRRGAAVG
ncbi:MAG: DNA polymerase III subunit delta [Gammaproteobacteria bacterium]|nr:DNA polymerase III subunit delta [Gammaproteobacteria bacterium]